MEPEIITNESQPGAEQNVPAADDKGADKTVSLKDLLNAALGKDFKDDATALKSTVDTFGYVGKVGKLAPRIEALQQKLGGENNLIKTMDDLINGQQAQPTDNSNFISRDEWKADKFFTTNPDLTPNRPVIEAFAKANGIPVEEAAVNPALKSLFDSAKAGQEIQQSQSVMQSNPRLGQVTDTFAQAQEAAKNGNYAQGADLVTNAVIESFPGLQGK